MNTSLENDHPVEMATAALDDDRFDQAMQLVRAGDREGYRELFAAFSRPLAAMARSLGLDEPNEAVNRIFLTAFGAIDRVTGRRLDFIAFLHTIALFEIEDSLPALSAEGIDRRARALRSLTRAQREALCLQVFFGLRSPEVAAATASSIPTVRWLKERADAAIRSAA